MSELPVGSDRWAGGEHGLEAARSPRGSASPLRAARSSTSSRSGPSAGFSLATRISSSSSSRTGRGSGRAVRPRELRARTDRAGASRPRGRAASSRPSSAASIAPGRGLRLVAGDEQVADLVEQPEGADLAGRDRRRAGGRGARSSGRQPADGRAGPSSTRSPRDADQRSVDRRSARGRSRWTWNVAHRRSIARRGRRRRAARAGRGQAGRPRRGRVAATCSIARRSSSRPDGSNS